MFQSDIAVSPLAATPELARAAARTALAVQNQFGSRDATEHLVKQLGIGTVRERDQSYFTEALHYHLGLLYGHAGEPALMADHLARSRTMPGPYDAALFSDHVTSSHFTNQHQLRAIRRGLPTILLACMPRSASGMLVHTLAHVFDIPVLHLSVGRFPDFLFVPSWLDMFLEGGAINHDHFGPGDFNLGVLAGRTTRDLFVLVRDPRAAARSHIHFAPPRMSAAETSLEALIEAACLTKFIPWLQGWIDLSNDPPPAMRIHWLTYREVCQDPAAAVRRIVGILQSDHPALAPFRHCQSVPEILIHRGAGDDEAWRAEVGPAASQRLWSACTPEIKELLSLKA